VVESKRAYRESMKRQGPGASEDGHEENSAAGDTEAAATESEG
jgi:hypothetical protein